jgi:hypothetical protein
MATSSRCDPTPFSRPEKLKSCKNYNFLILLPNLPHLFQIWQQQQPKLLNSGLSLISYKVIFSFSLMAWPIGIAYALGVMGREIESRQGIHGWFLKTS